MKHLTSFIYHPGGDRDAAGPKDKPENTNEETPSTSTDKDADKHEGVIDKIKHALQDWSNKDQADQNFDDTRV